MMKLVFFIIGLFVITIGFAWASSAVSLCYYSAPYVCTDVTAATPLPVYQP